MKKAGLRISGDRLFVTGRTGNFPAEMCATFFTDDPAGERIRYRRLRTGLKPGGSAGAFELSKKLGLETDGNKIVTDEKRATNIPGIYAAGDCIPGLQQIAKAVCDGMIAGTEALKFLKTIG